MVNKNVLFFESFYQFNCTIEIPDVCLILNEYVRLSSQG